MVLRANTLFIQHVVFPLMERVKGNHIRQNLRELLETEKLSADGLRALQEQKLRNLLLHTVEYVPFYEPYKELIPLIKDKPGVALAQFPILDKETVRTNFDRLVATDADRNQMFLNRTGGSTGQPVLFYLDRKTVEYYEAARWRGLSWWDIQVGDPCVMIWGSPIELNRQQLRRQRWKDRFLKNQVFIPSFDFRREKLQEYLKLIDSFRPRYLFGWASALRLFADFMIAEKRTLKAPLKAVLNTAETLHPEDREVIERAFQCPVINEYGARDGGLLAYQCPHGNLHMNVETMWMEVADVYTKQPVPLGEKGLVVVTDLNNYVMPRLRYQLGDMISLTNDSCSCGRALPLIKSLDGRENDTFVTVDGAFVNGQYFTNQARLLPTVRQFQIVQKSRTEVVLRLLDHPQLSEQDITSFVQGILDRMGKIDVRVERVQEIQRQASGKLRTSIREFSL